MCFAKHTGRAPVCVDVRHMSGLRPEVIAVIAIVIIVVLLFFSGKRRPKERTFSCGRCAVVVPHTSRTIEAWRAGKQKYFCNACHARWLRSRPVAGQTPAGNRGRSGCFSVLAVLILGPAVLVSAWWWTYA
jgi:hypothetical protein